MELLLYAASNLLQSHDHVLEGVFGHDFQWTLTHRLKETKNVVVGNLAKNCMESPGALFVAFMFIGHASTNQSIDDR